MNCAATRTPTIPAMRSTISFLTVIFPENQLNIMPYNRAVKDLNGRSRAEFIAQVENCFEITPSSAR